MPPDPMPVLELPLLRTKISIPQLLAGFLPRPGLLGRVDRGVKGPVTLVAAPAGFGKTSLLIQWARKTDLPVAWLTIDSGDNDVTRFFRYLVGALQTQKPGLGEEACDFIQSTRGAGLEVGLTLLVNEIAALPKEMALVLDDFQHLEEPAVLGGIGFLHRNLPPNLHLVLASRGEPALDLALPRATGRVVELGAGDLRFSGDEVAQFFRQATGLDLPPETVQALERRTEGWVTALQLAAMSLRHQPDPAAVLASLHGDAHYLVDFFAEEVLDRQPEEVRQFMLRSSVLELLTGPLCEAVAKPDAQPGYGAVMLDRLAHANLFVTALDEEREWFRYHPLFAGFLRHVEAEIHPAELPVLQKRAAVWSEQHASLDDACRYALASGDMEWTADLLERSTQAMITTGELFSLTHWIGKLPSEMIHQRPGLSLAYAWGAVAAYQLDLAQYWLDDVQRSLDERGERPGPAPSIDEPGTGEGFGGGGLWNVRGGLAVCQSTLAIVRGDLKQAAEFSRQATCHLRKENPFVRSLLALDDSLYVLLSGDTQEAIRSLRNTVGTARQANNLLVMIIAMCELAEMQALQGQLGQAWVTLRKAQYVAAGPEDKPLPLAGLVDVGLGEILLERGSLDEASAYLERGCRATVSLWSVSSLDAMVSLARLRQAQGDVAGSQAAIAEASELALGTESSQWDDTIVSAAAVRLALQRGDLAAAEQWWARGKFPDLPRTFALEDYPYHIFEHLLLIQARFLLVRGQDTGDARDLQQASELLGMLLLQAEQFGRTASRIEMLLLQAILQSALGESQAVETLLSALALGEPEGYRRVYLDEGRSISALLLRCLSAEQAPGRYLPSHGFVESLLADIRPAEGASRVVHEVIGRPGGPTTAETEDGLPVSLSAREMEVLALIAEGRSNKEIAARLYLALNTVKRHAYHIYAKLEVSKRTQAVSRARQMGLIP